MRAVIDANALFSALIKDSVSAELMFRMNLELYSPGFLLKELEKYKDLLLRKTHRSNEDFGEFLESVIEGIRFIDDLDDFAEEAKTISPDKDDWAYFATALFIDAPIWSNDKALKKQNRIKVYNTTELLRELGP